MADNAAVNEAKEVLAGKERNSQELLALAKELKGQDEFGYAWRLLARARRASDLPPELSTLLRQQQALCTYKDTHLHEERRLDRALEILKDGEDLETSTDPETLGLAGAIHKRRWRVRNDKRELEIALKYYRRGHQSDRKTEFRAMRGYPGINAAFVQDLLASLENGESSGATATLVALRRDEAKAIRTEIVDGVPRTMDLAADRTEYDWWPFVTMAEAHFGLRQYGQARKWLEDAAALPEVDPWEFEATARQLTTLARLLEGQAIDFPAKFEKSDAASVLRAFLGDRVTGVLTAYLGKVGLALSGGGFRASLYHIGVLAKLAELDVLRHVEVLSCVSGGSILGAYYYLELRQLLQTKADGDITPQDYIDLVKRIEKGFLEGVQENVRMRVLAEFRTNLKMIFFRRYSRTQRIGELYEERIYSKVKDGEEDAERWLTDLFIVPANEEDFHPRRDNWRRNHKVPILILNATTLNTGHNWQFTASWMGEPPTTVDPDIDSNYRLRRMYYREAPEPHKRIRLGTAVGASSCVPGLFEPIELSGLYEHDSGSKIAVRLIDGGVHDNQGVVGLIEQDCDVMLVSDASGQMETDDDPSRGILGVPLRSNSILMSRVREAEYDDVMERRRAELVRNFMFIHLKMDLEADPVDWIGCDEPYQASEDAQPLERRGPLTRYGIRKSVQRLLAAIRTDLDSFNDAEAYALMLSGYRMTEFQYARWIRGFPDAPQLEGELPWRFLEVEPMLKKAKGGARILRILEVGSATAFKVWNLWTPLKVARIILSLALALAALGGLVWAYSEFRQESILSVGQIGVFLIGAVLTGVLTAVLGKWVMRMVRFRETITKILIGVGMSAVGFLVARLHLHVFDKIYLRLGRLDRLEL